MRKAFKNVPQDRNPESAIANLTTPDRNLQDLRHYNETRDSRRRRWPQRFSNTKYCFKAKNTVSLHYAVSLFFTSKWCGSKTSMCPSWSAAPEVLTNLQWPVCVLPSLIAPCISVWCESNHCSKRPAGPQRSHTFIITLYCKTFHGHSAPNSLCDKNRAFPLLSFWWFQF